MPLPLPDQQTHRAYIRTVAHTLTAAGIRVCSVSFPHNDDPDLILWRRAVLDLDMRVTHHAYGDQRVSLLWSDETGWSIAWGPAGGVCGACFTVCRFLVPEPGEVVAAAHTVLSDPPTEDVPCPFRSCDDYDEELETVLDTYTVREDSGMGRVMARLEEYRELVGRTSPSAAFPGHVERDSVAAGLLLALARRLSGGDEAEAVERAAWHLAVTGLWCPRPAEHHTHHEGPTVPAVDVDLLLALEVHAGNYSVRGLAARYAHLGVTRNCVRAVLRAVAPEYMDSQAQRHGPHRLTVRDHTGNRGRRRKGLRYVPMQDIRDARLSRLLLTTGRANQWSGTW
ncbi:DUF6292 family protein [Streptomyces sp. SRF1]|uniref:DUF6292 family protein n=1 Tax=Streptomyces sp. SRF1 TaxID=1549642 RepID=UPI0025B17561|nr:DUF6292 family protein [Streptomyces sp. SRF1]MDN3056859.1 DUF6292 family protein [Streptomyces sp. SRF1]